MQWMTTIENISEIARIPFLEVFEMKLEDFLNLLSYLIYKNKKINQQYKQNGI